MDCQIYLKGLCDSSNMKKTLLFNASYSLFAVVFYTPLELKTRTSLDVKPQFKFFQKKLTRREVRNKALGLYRLTLALQLAWKFINNLLCSSSVVSCSRKPNRSEPDDRCVTCD